MNQDGSMIYEKRGGARFSKFQSFIPSQLNPIPLSM
jgi:hypothetical protein